MKTLLKEYRTFFIFLGKFLLFYIVFAALYQLYLSNNITPEKPVDDVTILVSSHVNVFLQYLGDEFAITRVAFEPHVRLLHNGNYLLRIVEGCNAVSVMIMFAAFVFAFSIKIKNTLFFIVIGLLSIHFFNVLRIGLLMYAKVHFPEYNTVLHDLVFPLVIYGWVIFLWLLWMNKFTKYVAVQKK